jgi:predicted RNase H-like HicB family nuclease
MIRVMKKYIVLYHAPTGAMEQMAGATPEEAKKGMEAWMEWAKKLGSGLVDLGTPLGNGRKVTKEGIAPSTHDVVGYSILEAETIDAAVEMLKEHPHLWTEQCSIEVHEALSLPGM